MPGMTSGVGTGNVLVTEAFRAALRHQLLIVAAIFALLGLARLVAAGAQPSGHRGLAVVVRGGTGRCRPAGPGDVMGRRTPLAVAAALLAMTAGRRLARGAVTWRRIQVLHVPVQYGSSG